MSRFYNDTITELFLNPSHAGHLADANKTFRAGTPGQSDVLELQLKIDHHCIKQARFKASGKMTTIAAGEYLCQWLENKMLHETTGLNSQQIIEALQLPSSRYSAAILAQQAFQQAMK